MSVIDEVKQSVRFKLNDQQAVLMLRLIISQTETDKIWGEQLACQVRAEWKGHNFNRAIKHAMALDWELDSTGREELRESVFAMLAIILDMPTALDLE